MNNYFENKIWFPTIKKYWRKTILLIVAGVIVNYLTLLLTLSIGKYFQLAATGSSGKTKALQLMGIHLPDSSAMFFTFFFLVVAIRFLISWSYSFQMAALGEMFINGLRSQLFNYHQENAKFGKQNTSVLLPYSSEAKTLQKLLTRGVIGFVKELLFIIMSLYLLFALSFQLTMLLLFLISVCFMLFRTGARSLKTLTQQKNKHHAAMLAYVSKSVLSGDKDRLSATAEFNKRNNRYSTSTRKLGLRQSFLNVLPPAMLSAVLGITMLVMLYSQPFMLKEKTDVLTYILLLLSITPALRSIIKIENTWTKGKLAAKRYSRINNTKETATQGSSVEKASIISLR